MRGGQVGAVSFIQFFGSALQVTPHFHSLVPDGVVVPREGGVRFEALPPPTQGSAPPLHLSPSTWSLSRLYATDGPPERLIPWSDETGPSGEVRR